MNQAASFNLLANTPSYKPEIDITFQATTQPGYSLGSIHLVGVEVTPQTLVMSLGNPESLNTEKIRQAGGHLVKWLAEHQVKKATARLSGLEDLNIPGSRQAFMEGAYLGSYRFDKHKSKPQETVALQLNLVSNHTGLGAEIQAATEMCSAQLLARDISNEPPNVINPVTLAARAEALSAELGLKCQVFDNQQLEAMGAGAIVAVGKGSHTASRLIVMEYPGSGAGKSAAPVVVVGKAITFDTGGYSIKTTESIQNMKHDKSGAAAVLGIMQAVARLKIKTPVVGILAAAENMISGFSFRPDDILTAMNGTTVEILSTDAEGRLVLADALAYACKHFQPQAIIDLATLTGGVGTALGNVRAGIMANNQSLADAIFAAGERTYERAWQLPLDDEYFEQIKGDHADIKNSGGKLASPIIGGIFLKQFVSDSIPWVHIDIAATAATTKPLPYCPKGATGFGVRLVVNYLEQL